ncbi:MAG: DNA mismatch repair protein MutS [Chitinophagaceae bacterium]|nr:DNA mismatch repair protein MutS [Chitinophagaceae bacterium]
MVIDQTTYNDLAIFQSDESFSVFHRINFTQTVEGREWLFRYLNNPFKELKQIKETQEIISLMASNEEHWPVQISNGTLMVIDKFFDSNIDGMPDSANMLNAFTYRVFHAPDFALVRYSLTHFADFFQGMNKWIESIKNKPMPSLMSSLMARVKDLLNKPVIQKLINRDSKQPFTWSETIYFGNSIKEQFRSPTNELVGIFGRLDAWHSMAIAQKELKLTLPEFIETDQPLLEAKDLFHVLLPTPVPYDVALHKESNFIFLTGANMAGKSTFIKAVGDAVFLAHVGMGVPASHMKLSLFDGLLSNINVVDNIIKGESYFFNEVQRIKNTILKINDGRKWLVLIDELFKGTNVQDAMKCSLTVIKGLIKIKNSLFILSTHLYEIGEELKQHPNISFRYFETAVEEEQLSFSYQLKEGISNDRLGYLILKREKVVSLLEQL